MTKIKIGDTVQLNNNLIIGVVIKECVFYDEEAFYVETEDNAFIASKSCWNLIISAEEELNEPKV